MSATTNWLLEIVWKKWRHGGKAGTNKSKEEQDVQEAILCSKADAMLTPFRISDRWQDNNVLASYRASSSELDYYYTFMVSPQQAVKRFIQRCIQGFPLLSYTEEAFDLALIAQAALKLITAQSDEEIRWLTHPVGHHHGRMLVKSFGASGCRLRRGNYSQTTKTESC